ncbi:MAG: peptidoglycan editing factor PgeF [Rhodocyclaceae bacterium]
MATVTTTDPWYVPDWPLPAGVHALQTTRCGGVSRAPWNSFNLGDHVGDRAEDVAANRALLALVLPAQPCWLQQVHGVAVFDADTAIEATPGPQADAVFSRQSGRVCAVMTADCLPVLFCERNGGVVAAAHAGWRGLRAGVLEATLAAMRVAPAQVMAWLGPAIGPAAFEVGAEVRQAFVGDDAAAAAAFVAGTDGRYFADLYLLARQRLQRAGVTAIHGGNACTLLDAERYFSYRRDGVTGRMATLIWRGAPL